MGVQLSAEMMLRTISSASWGMLYCMCFQRQASSTQRTLWFIMGSGSGFGFPVISSGVFRFGLGGLLGFFGLGGIFLGWALGLLFVFHNSVFSSLVVWVSLLLPFLCIN